MRVRGVCERGGYRGERGACIKVIHIIIKLCRWTYNTTIH